MPMLQLPVADGTAGQLAQPDRGWSLAPRWPPIGGSRVWPTEGCVGCAKPARHWSPWGRASRLQSLPIRF